MNSYIIINFIAALAVVNVTSQLLNSDTGGELHISDVIHDRERRAADLACPKEIVTDDQEVFCANKDNKTWQQADAYCKGLKYELAQPKYLHSLASKLYETQDCGCWYWLGGKGSGSQQLWQNGSVVDPGHSVWIENHPLNKITDCLVLKSGNTSTQNLKTDNCSNPSGHTVCSIGYLDKKFIKGPLGVSVLSRERAEFQCEAPMGIPKPNITWTVNGSSIEEDGRKTTFENGTLVLEEVYPLDNGKYVCHASNKAGKVSSAPAFLHVIGTSEFEVITKESSCFALSPTKRTWNAANKWCEGHNSILAEPKEDLRLLQKRITKVELEVTEYWLGRSGIKRTTEWTEEGAKIISQNGDSSSCTLYNSTENPGTLSSENCSDLYHFICQLDRSLCVIPKILKPALKDFTETNLTVSLPTNEDWNYIKVVYVVVFPRYVNGSTSKKWNAENRAWDAEFSARLKNNSWTGKYFWIARIIDKYDPGMNCVIGDNKTYGEILNKQLEDDMQYYVVLVGHTKLGNFTLYKSGEFGGPFHVTAYKPLDLLQLLAVIGATSFTLCLAMGIYTIIEKYRN